MEFLRSTLLFKTKASSTITKGDSMLGTRLVSWLLAGLPRLYTAWDPGLYFANSHASLYIMPTLALV